MTLIDWIYLIACFAVVLYSGSPEGKQFLSQYWVFPTWCTFVILHMFLSPRLYIWSLEGRFRHNHRRRHGIPFKVLQKGWSISQIAGVCKENIRLLKILKAHEKWLQPGAVGGQCADLHGENLQGVDFAGVNLSQANLDGADLRGADFSQAVLIQTKMCNANLRGAVLNGTDLRGASLRGADLRGVEMSFGNLYGSSLSGANLQGAQLDASLEQPGK